MVKGWWLSEGAVKCHLSADFWINSGEKRVAVCFQNDSQDFFKVVAKYMPVKNTILNGRVVEKKNPQGPAPLNMPAWGETLSDTDVSAVIAYLISVY